MQSVNSFADRLSNWNQFCLSSFWFAMNLLWGAVLLILIPSQIKDIVPKHPAETMGLMLGVGAVPGFVVPLLAGPFSDRCMSRMGRRRPYMIVGVAITLFGLVFLWLGGRLFDLVYYFTGYMITQIGINIAGGAYNGIIPDIVPKDQRGSASGWMAVMSQAGTIVGVISAMLLVNAGQSGLAYLVVCLFLLVFMLISVLGITEIPRTEKPTKLDIWEFIKSLWIDPRKHPNFAWVWITRFLVVMGIWCVQEYMQFYLTDMIGIAEGKKELFAGYVMIIVLFGATLTGMMGGNISDKSGRKPVVYVANTLIALACFAFVYSQTIVHTFIIALLFGLGYGAYYSVDWALGCDVLPNKDEAGKDMAVWHIAFVLPQSIILPIAGFVLGSFGRTFVQTETGAVAHYTWNGYFALYVMAASLLLLAALLLRNVKGVR